jgi:hypothetical protein
MTFFAECKRLADEPRDIVSYYSLREIARRFPGVCGGFLRGSPRRRFEERRPRTRLKRVLPVLLPWAVFALLTLISWSRWIEPYVDSGRELMVPWRVAQGERLYRDVAFYHGPLGPFLAAGIDRLAGRSLPARTLLCAAIALLHLEGLRRLAGLLASPGRAALTASLAVALAAFLRPGGWLFPFSLDASIAVAALTWALTFSHGKASASRDRAAGICLALAFWARPELGALGAVAAVVGARGDPRRWLPLAVWPGAAGAAGYAAVSWGVPFSTLISSGWLVVLNPPTAFQNVYRVYAGLDQPGLRLTELALVSIVLLSIGALLAVGAKAAGSTRTGSNAVTAVVALGLVATAAISLRPPEEYAGTLALLPPLVRVVPPLVLALAVARGVRALARRSLGPLSEVPDAVLLVAALFSLRLLLAAGYAGPYNAYFLPLPTLVASLAVLRLADRATVSLGPALPRLAAAALAVFLISRIAALADLYRRSTWSPVATPAGEVHLLEPVASATSLALADLARRLRPAGTLVGFPEGGFFNYVLGQRTPLREEQFFPGRLDAAAERAVARRLVEQPPDAILLANVHAVGEGARAFGKDYFVELAASIDRRFRVVAAFGPGARPSAAIGDPQFFIEIRVPAVPAPR